MIKTEAPNEVKTAARALKVSTTSVIIKLTHPKTTINPSIPTSDILSILKSMGCISINFERVFVLKALNLSAFYLL